MGTHLAAARASRFRRVRAVLAGALVLGVGGTATMAAWTDTEYAAGTFGASVFAVESTAVKPFSAAGPWTVNETAPGATLVFDATGMYPERRVYAPIALRTQPRSVSGTVTLGGAAVVNTPTTAPLLGSALVYRVVRSATCDAAVFGAGAAFVVGSASTYQPLTAGQNTGVVSALPAAGPTTPGAAVNFCFEVLLPAEADNGLQGTSATAVWQFTAVSTS